MRDHILEPDRIIDISALEQELSYQKLEKGIIRIGTLSTHADLSRSELILEWIPALAQACRTIGSQPIRNRGTIGGNIANGSPAADVVPVLVALDATVKLVSIETEREIRLDEFIVSPGRTALKKNEIISEICIPIGEQSYEGLFKKHGERNALVIATASVAVLVGDKDKKVRVAYGALSASPLRARELEKLLNEEGVREWGAIKKVIEETVKPISDIRASAEYRMEIACNLTYMSLVELGILEYKY
jgi:CO/xanthine dehydrogenase FAD-binding subunit